MINPTKRIAFIAILVILGVIIQSAFSQEQQQPGTCVAWFPDTDEAIIGRSANTDMTWRCDTSLMTLPSIGTDSTGIPMNTPIVIEFPVAYSSLTNADKIKCRYSVDSTNVSGGTAFNKVDLLPPASGETAIVTMTHNKDIKLAQGNILRLWCDGLSTPPAAAQPETTPYIIGADAEIAEGTIAWPAVYATKEEIPQSFTIISLTGTLPAVVQAPTPTAPRADGTLQQDEPKRPKIDMDKLDSLKSSIQGVLGSGISLSHYQTAYDPASNTLTTMHRISDSKRVYDPDLIDDHIATEDIQKVILENVGLVYPELTNVVIEALEATIPNCDNMQGNPEAKGKGSTTGTKYCAVDAEGCAPCKVKSVCTEDTQCEFSRCDEGKCIKINSAAILGMTNAFAAVALAILGLAF